MKKVTMMLITTVMLIILFGCFTSSFNKLGHEEILIYENDDQTIRFEIRMETSAIGRLSVSINDIVHSFVAEYNIIQEYLNVYITSPALEDSTFSLKVSFEVNNFISLNYDVMYIKENNNLVNNEEHEIFTGFDVTLNRVYDDEMNPLNYFYNQWQSTDETFVFINDKLDYYYSTSIRGTLNGEDVWISFQDQSFTIWSVEDLNIKLSGAFSLESQNIIIEPFEWYTDYPSMITLSFEYHNE